jgi:hypothetical protein
MTTVLKDSHIHDLVVGSGSNPPAPHPTGIAGIPSFYSLYLSVSLLVYLLNVYSIRYRGVKGTVQRDGSGRN